MLGNRAERLVLTPSEAWPDEGLDVELLLASHAEKAIRIAQRILRGDRATAENIAQDAFARAFVALPRFRGEAEVSTWLHSIVVNESLRRLRRKRVRDRFRALSRPPEPEPPMTSDPGLRRRLAVALDRLTDRERAVFVLVHLEGHSTAQTAELLGKRQGTVKSQLHRALVKLRRELSDCWEGIR